MTKKGMGLLLLMGILIITIYPHTANPLPYGNVLFVDDDFTPDPSNNKFNDIQAAINAANDGDIIYIFEGIYEGNIWVDKELRIIGEAAGKVVIDGNGRNYAVNIVQNNVIVENLTINNGIVAGIGTGIYSDNVNVTIKNCIIHGTKEYGLEILSDSVTVINCTIYGTHVGIKISATNVTLAHSSVYETEWGIVVEGAENCVLQNTEIHDIENKSIKVQDSEDVLIKNVTAFDSFCGLWLKNASDSTVISSNFSDNRIGIRIEESENNTIESNLIANNVGYGIYAIDSFNNTIHHNNFINNGINAYDTGNNIWNSSIGNYWDDYKGYDGNGDGIGELPYEIGGNADYMPIIHQISSPPVFVWVDDDYDEATPGWMLDHFASLQEAIDVLAINGRCYVYEGNYSGFTIYKAITVSAEKGSIYSAEDGIFISANDVSVEGFTISALENGIKIQNASNVSISSCKVSGGTFGLYAVNAAECSVTGCEFFGNVKGMYLFSSSQFVISNCSIHDNEYFGIEISHSSSDNFIFDCTFENNEKYGIYITHSSNNNKIYHNNFLNNTAYDECSNEWNASYEKAMGNYWSDYNGNDANNDGIGDTPYILDGGGIDAYPLMHRITNPPSFVWVNEIYDEAMPGWMLDHFTSISDAIAKLKEGGSCYVFSGIYRENIIINKTIALTGSGAWSSIIEGAGNTAIKVAARGTKIEGIGVRDCWNDAAILIIASDVKIKNCISYNSYHGIYINAYNATVENCEFFDNTLNGVYLYSTYSSTFIGCRIYGNNNGMVLVLSSYNDIERCEFSNNSVYALKILNSYANTLYHNDFYDNLVGCYLENSADNLIYFSNFIGNTQHVVDYNANMWDNGSVGNYWDDYDGVDTNWDGIGDTPYEIDANSIDHYPLIREAGFPIAYFTWEPLQPYTFETVYFYDASIDLDGAIVSWLWDFGDGNISYEKNPTHYYADNGIYIVNLTVTDNDGRMAWMEEEITVLNTPPLANFTWEPQHPTDIDEIIFNASLSYDIDGFITNYTWDFGDGWIAYGVEVKHVYADNGNYTVNLTIIDDDGATAYVTRVITVRNVPPVANFIFKPYEPTDLDTIEFTDKSYDLDGNIVNYTWNFGDGNISYEKNPMHQYKNNGVYVVSLTIVDDDGDISQISKAILVKNVPPVANFTWQPQNPTDLETITFTSTSYDPDGSIVNYTWSFGNGNKSYETNATWKYADDGLYIVTLTVVDDDGAKTIMEKEINVSNVPPKALFTVKPTKPRQDEKVVFNASTSHDPDGDIVNYMWDFQSDGVTDAYGLEVTHKYEKKGNYFVTLTIVDDDGASDSMQILVNVREKEKVPGFEFIIIIAASAILILMRRQKRGIWRI